MNKKKKCALGLVALFAAAAALAGCDKPTPSKEGVIFTYTDANGVRTNYTAEDLLMDYQKSGSSLSTQYDKVLEVLIRNYYEDDARKSTKATLEEKARQDVVKDREKAQSNSKSNGTTYEKEFEAILESKNVENVDELYERYLYDEEKQKFQDDFYENFNGLADNGVDAIRDGVLKDGSAAFPKSDYGRGNEGWIKEQMPYHIRHILVKVSEGKAGEFTQDKIGETSTAGQYGEARKLANVIFTLAGAKVAGTDDKGYEFNPVSAKERWTFADIAREFSEDTGSGKNAGDLRGDDSSGIMTKVMSSDLVHEYKLGVYAYESLYNQREKATAYGAANAYRLMPGLEADATSAADVDANQKIDGTTVNQYFVDKGIGQIPFGAALALFDQANVTTDENGAEVDENNSAFYPRNIIFNKYFNKHNVCVITPNAIPMNGVQRLRKGTATPVVWTGVDEVKSRGEELLANYAENIEAYANDEVGVASSLFKSLPGFQTDTSEILPGINENVLTDERGNVILAVRAGASSYQGIHFIVVERSALSEFGLTATVNEDGQVTKLEENAADSLSAGIPAIKDYYTTATPSMAKYPTYTVDGKSKKAETWVTFNTLKSDTSALSKASSNLIKDIKGYNGNLETYQFQTLVKSVEFVDKKLEKDLQTFVSTKRQSTFDDEFKTWADNWREYAEMLQAQDEAREIGKTTGMGTLISEVCAVGYGKVTKSELWAKGGACYYGTK